MVLLTSPFWKARHVADPSVLFRNTAEECLILNIRLVAFGFGSTDCEVECWLYRAPGDSQVFEACAQKGNGGYMSHHRMLRRDLGEHEISGDHIMHVQPCHKRGRQRHPSVTGLGAARPCYVHVGRLERHAARTVVFQKLRAKAALLWEMNRCVTAELPCQGIVCIRANGVRVSVEEIGASDTVGALNLDPCCRRVLSERAFNLCESVRGEHRCQTGQSPNVHQLVEKRSAVGTHGIVSFRALRARRILSQKVILCKSFNLHRLLTRLSDRSND